MISVIDVFLGFFRLRSHYTKPQDGQRRQRAVSAWTANAWATAKRPLPAPRVATSRSSCFTGAHLAIVAAAVDKLIDPPGEN